MASLNWAKYNFSLLEIGHNQFDLANFERYLGLYILVLKILTNPSKYLLSVLALATMIKTLLDTHMQAAFLSLIFGIF